MKILFIGNSFTYMNAMPENIFSLLCASMGKEAYIYSVTKGGYKLSQYADPENEQGQRLRQLLSSEVFDLAVLQEQSVLPASDPEAFFEGARSLAALIGSYGTKNLMLYETWGHLKGSKRFDDMGITTEQMEALLRVSYMRLSDEMGLPLALVGKAFGECRAKYPDIALIAQDCHHPTYAGSYLAALVIFRQVWKESVKSGAFCGELDRETAQQLIEIAAI